MKLNTTLLALLLLALLPAYGQQRETAGYATFVDSIRCGMRMHAPANRQRHADTARRIWREVQQVQSRRGWLTASYDDSSPYITYSTAEHLQMALDIWEEAFDTIAVPVHFFVSFSESLGSGVAMMSKVRYCRTSRTSSMPFSLYCQQYYERETSTDTIFVNADVEWNDDWPWNYYEYGSTGFGASLTTAFLRHIGHILGFGTSVTVSGGQVGFTVKNAPSPFDSLIADTLGNRLSALAGTLPGAAFQDFLRRQLALVTPGGSHRLYSDSTAYVPYRSGMYFALSSGCLMNCPVTDPDELLTVDAPLLDAMEAIGWAVRPHDVCIKADSLDAAGYGSIYRQLTFRAENNGGGTVTDAGWTLQVFHGQTGSYQTVVTGQGPSFTPGTIPVAADAVSEAGHLQGRVVCDVASTQKKYAVPVFLELRPELDSLQVRNVTTSDDGDNISFDVVVGSIGATSGQLFVRNSLSPQMIYDWDGDGCRTIHVTNVLNHGTTWIEAVLANDYGENSKVLSVSGQAPGTAREADGQQLDVALNGKTVEGVLVAHDGDVVSAALAAGQPDTGGEVVWQMLMMRGNGTYWQKQIEDNGGRCSFIISPGFFDRNKKVTQLFDCLTDPASRTVYSSGIIRCTVSRAGEQPIVTEHPLRLEVLPQLPLVSITSYREEFDTSTQMVWPVVTLSVEAANFDWGFIETSDAAWQGAIGEAFPGTAAMPHRVEIDWGSQGCGYRCFTQNGYGTVTGDYVFPTEQMLAVSPTEAETLRVTLSGRHCHIVCPQVADRIVVASAAGRIVAVGEHVKTLEAILPQGLNIVTVQRQQQRTVKKIYCAF